LADLFAQELERTGETSRQAAEAGAALVARGYHAQATPQADSAALFRLDGGRELIRREDTAFRVGADRVAAAELLRQVREQPERFSPNVLLRPIAQDTLFPTA